MEENKTHFSDEEYLKLIEYIRDYRLDYMKTEDWETLSNHAQFLYFNHKEDAEIIVKIASTEPINKIAEEITKVFVNSEICKPNPPAAIVKGFISDFEQQLQNIRETEEYHNNIDKRYLEELDDRLESACREMQFVKTDGDIKYVKKLIDRTKTTIKEYRARFGYKECEVIE